MARLVVVADASVLIAFDQLEQLSLLEKLYDEILIPPAVQREIAPGRPPLPAWIHTEPLRRALDHRVVAASLHVGESEAISPALEVRADQVILDDRPARRVAKDVGLAVVGTAGVLFAAKQRVLLASCVHPSTPFAWRASASARTSTRRS